MKRTRCVPKQEGQFTMKIKMLAATGLAVALAVAPLSSAYAWRGHDHWHGGPLIWPFAAAAAVVAGAATIAAAPVEAGAAPGPYYAPPVYYAPPGYYQPPGYAPYR